MLQLTKQLKKINYQILSLRFVLFQSWEQFIPVCWVTSVPIQNFSLASKSSSICSIDKLSTLSRPSIIWKTKWPQGSSASYGILGESPSERSSIDYMLCWMLCDAGIVQPFQQSAEAASIDPCNLMDSPWLPSEVYTRDIYVNTMRRPSI